MRPFRFMVHTGRNAVIADWPATVRRAEALGYAAVYVTDHLGPRQLSPIASLASAAMVTSTIRLGSYVFANDFRHPLILAREAASIDRLSNGRLELGLGAGWKRSDYRQLGMAYEPPPVRIGRLTEAVGLVRRLLAGEVVSHAGPHYRLDRAGVGPAPVQRPHPPIMIGGGGPRLLRLAAREADIVGLAPQMSRGGRPMPRSAGDDAVARRVETVRRAAGGRFESLELNAFVGDAGIVGGPQPIGPSVAAFLKSGGPAIIGGSPFLLFGTRAQLRESLLRRRERMGISSYGIPLRAMEAFAPLVDELQGR